MPLSVRQRRKQSGGHGGSTCAVAALLLFGLATGFMSEAAASSVPQAPLAPQAASLQVLDIEKRRIIEGRRFPTNAGPTCDVLVIGGGTGGVAAAYAAGLKGMSVILVEPTQALGGQFTSQLVSVPDENRFIEQDNGPSTRFYRLLRKQVRDYYATQPGIIAGREKNVGLCWVSRVSALPSVWETMVDARMEELQRLRRLRGVYRRHQLRDIAFLANGRFNYADVVDLDTGEVVRIGAHYLLDATEDGSALHMAGLPTSIGQEAREEYGEAHAPEERRPDWVQSFTYCFAVRWQREGPHHLVEKPVEYDYFKSLGEYTLDYVYSERGTVRYKVLEKAPESGGPFWTYRRLVASSSFAEPPDSPEGDIALINWRGNDFHEETYLGKPIEEQARVLERGRAFALGFLYWLQNECPRDDGSGNGYPEMQMVGSGEMAGLDPDGFALHPYVRESRRLQAQFTLNENHLTAPKDNPEAKWGEEFPDSVGCALYAIDIHPTKGEPPLLVPALPYHLPLGSFLARSGPTNVLPAAKNFGASRLALASARMHPTEWLVGEVAGSLAAFCIRRNIDNPAEVRDSPELLQEFRGELRGQGVTLAWSEIIQ